jgi:signal transduction histidine kinase
MDPPEGRPHAHERSLPSGEVTLQNATLGQLSRPAISARARDLLVALLAFGLTLLLLSTGGTSRGLGPLGAVIAAFASFPLVARRRAPLAVLAVTTLASSLFALLGFSLGPPFGPTFALFFVAVDERTRGRIRETAPLVLALFAIHVASAASTENGFPTSPVLFGTIVWGGAWMIGDQLRQRRQRVTAGEERLLQTERETVRERRLAVAEERNRIARDLHDSAAHSINVILVQAGAARLLQQRDPDAARAALTTIEEVARETIGEIDQLIRGLREGDGRDADDPVEPPTRLAALETLADRNRAAGLPVELRIDGDPRPLAPALDQAAFRIVQESLTNAARHGSGPVDVDVGYGEAELELTISNPAEPGLDAAEVGHGILGMRERAGLLGGSLAAGLGSGRFRVHARLPYVSGEQAE